MGYSSFMYDIVAALSNASAKIVSVVTHINEAGLIGDYESSLAQRGLYYSMTDVANKANTDLTVLTDPNEANAIAEIKETGANIILSCSAPILSKKFIQSFNGMTFNFHGSKIYRGRGGWSWLILNDQKSDSVILHWLDVGIDTGGKIAEAPFFWSNNSYPIDLIESQRNCFAPLIEKFIDYLNADQIPNEVQSTFRPYFPSLNTQLDGWINWSESPDSIMKTIQAFGWPYPGASSKVELSNRTAGDPIKLARASVTNSADTTKFHAKTNGCVVGVEKSGDVHIACNGGILTIHTLREGVNEIPAKNILRLGMRLVTN